MVEVLFNYEGNIISIQCNIKDKMSDIIDKFLLKAGIKENNILYYLYKDSKINCELTLMEIANDTDKNRNKMDIIVIKKDENINIINEIISKNIICPECKENILMKFNNFKIDLFECKNNHKIEDILLNKFKETQKITLNQIFCDLCNYNNNNIKNNEFYICNTCNKNICPLCKSKHDKNHIIINYDEKNYICHNHNQTYIKYCKSCNKNLCKNCENDHKYHYIIDYETNNKNDLLKLMENLRAVINEFKNKINLIKEIFNKMIGILEIYYNINNNIINNYDINKVNYFTIENINNIKKDVELKIKDISNYNINEIYQFSLNNFYNENGEKYIGDLKNNSKYGKGFLFFDNGDLYDGDFKDNLRNGKGIIFNIMEIDLKVNGKMIKKKDKEYIIIEMEIFMKANGEMIKEKEKGNVIILMVINMRVIGKMT